MTKVENRMRPECLALDWQRALGLHDFQLSIVDINVSTLKTMVNIKFTEIS